MRVYHGADGFFGRPRILTPKLALDFGPGFYTTTARSQAEK
jgi:hypothetical protein